jgi:hypothetical protein
LTRPSRSTSAASEPPRRGKHGGGTPLRAQPRAKPRTSAPSSAAAKWPPGTRSVSRKSYGHPPIDPDSVPCASPAAGRHRPGRR